MQSTSGCGLPPGAVYFQVQSTSGAVYLRCGLPPAAVYLRLRSTFRCGLPSGVVYLQGVDMKGVAHVGLVIAKAEVAPIKTHDISSVGIVWGTDCSPSPQTYVKPP